MRNIPPVRITSGRAPPSSVAMFTALVMMVRFGGIRLDFVEPFNNVAVTVQHVALDCAVAIGDRLTARELASGFDIHVDWSRSYERCVDGHPERERIIHRRAVGTELRRQINQVVRHLVDEIIYGPMGLSELFEVLWRQQCLIADIEADHGQRPTGLENDLRGFGVPMPFR